jgi:serine protease Do
MHRYKKYLSAVVILALGLLAGQAISSTIKLNPIKPTGSNQPLTDEQQGILAVRTAKASVVSILGLSKTQTSASLATGTPVVVAAPPDEVSGTGFIIEADGLIVTNNHVVDDPGFDYFVDMPDGTEYPASVLGADKIDDVALLKIDAGNLTPAKLGDSDSLETGQTVFAIGNSLGRYQNTVTRGVVSGLSRAIDEPSSQALPTTHSWIQTDAAINLGNSGGPLIDLAGEVVGMDTLIDSGGDSLGFALPINLVKDAVTQLKTFGTVSRPYLGVQFKTIDPRLQQSLNLPVKNGAYIVLVIQDGPAHAAGIWDRDIVTAINNFNLDQVNPLDAVIQKYKAGDQVTLKILRNGKEMDFPLVLGQLK